MVYSASTLPEPGCQRLSKECFSSHHDGGFTIILPNNLQTVDVKTICQYLSTHCGSITFLRKGIMTASLQDWEHQYSSRLWQRFLSNSTSSSARRCLRKFGALSSGPAALLILICSGTLRSSSWWKACFGVRLGHLNSNCIFWQCCLTASLLTQSLVLLLTLASS